MDTLKEAAEQKEKEWRQIQEQRIQMLEKSLSQKTSELKDEKSKFEQLRQDFKYNLKLLEERDSELEKFEQSISNIRRQLSEKNAEISDLKIRLDDYKKLKEEEKNSLDELKKYYINRLNQKNNDLEKYKNAKDMEIGVERTQIEKLKRTLQIQIKDLEFDLDKQRDEMRNEFDQIMKKSEHEHRIQTDEFNTTILAKDLEIKMLRNELSYVRQDLDKVKDTTEHTETNVKDMQRLLKEKEWQLHDTSVIKDAQIKDLQSKIANMETKNASVLEDLKRKNQESNRLLNEKNFLIENLKSSLEEEKLKIINLSQQLNEYKNIKFDNSEEDNLRQQMELRETELKTAREEIEKLKAKQTVRTNFDQDLKYDIESLRSRCAQLEAEKSSVEAGWRAKYLELENSKIENSDLVNKSVQESRDQALAQVQNLEQKLAYKESVIKSILSSDPLGTHLDQIQNLSESKLADENEKLKLIIKQMRQEMEMVATGENNGADKFNQDLEKQLFELKQKNRDLQSKIDEYVLGQKIPDSKLTDNTILNSHMKSLNETIDLLRKEKVDLTAFCKKQQAKLVCLEKQANDASEKERVKQTQLDTLKYELGCQERRMSTEISNLRTIVQNLELELQTTRHEADEYHKITIEKNSEISSLEHRITELNLKLSSSGQTINFGAQELFIEQLKEEIKRLSDLNQQMQIKTRQLNHENLRLKQGQNGRENVIDDSESDEEVEVKRRQEIDALKVKLKTAAKYINSLIGEKEHLIELSNQLRGELNRVKFDNESLALVRANRESEFMVEMVKPRTVFSGRLEQLEKQQYELTKRQLSENKKADLPVRDKQVYKVNNYSNEIGLSTDETVSSSVKSENLKEIWKILEENVDQSAEIKPQVKKAVINASKSPSLKPKTPRQMGKNPIQKPKIRNYNFKD
ncbi:coiled-coil domain-containing 57 [Brachionus plicatilis]|uniref:Coiled-coil domain-containing 57 n=1 Tax=Brachionus plicatilis TaxID=10195 RepID=A0A3M7STP7_BRAPC|nr:coiled-coil domain-containing 57 [Brachionus plicatilis]